MSKNDPKNLFNGELGELNELFLVRLKLFYNCPLPSHEGRVGESLLFYKFALGIKDMFAFEDIQMIVNEHLRTFVIGHL